LNVSRAKSWSRAQSGCLPYCTAGATSQSGLAARVARLLGALVGGVKPVADQVQKDAQQVLRHHFDRCGLAVEIALQGDVEILVPGSALSAARRRSHRAQSNKLNHKRRFSDDGLTGH